MEPQSLRSQLEAALEKKDAFQLEKLSTTAIDQHPDAIWPLEYQAKAKLLNWKYTEAQEAYDHLISINPENKSDYLLEKADAYILNHHVDKAKSIYQQLLTENKDSVPALIGMAKALLGEWKGEEALPLLEQAADLGAADKEFLLLRAKALVEANRPEQALPIIEKASEGQFDEAVSLLKIEAFKKQQNQQAVVATYRELEQAMPEAGTHAANLAHYLLQVQDFQQAEAQYSKIYEADLAKGWDGAFYLKGRAEARMKMQKYEDAIADLNRLLDIDSSDSSCLKLRAEAYLGLNNKEAALQDLSKALEQSKSFGRTELLKQRAQLYLEQEQWALAIGDFQELEQDSFHRADACYGLGMAEKGQGNLEAAYQHWVKAKTLRQPQAAAAIAQYCKAFEEAEGAALRNKLEQEFQEEFQRNAASPFLQSIMGKFWKINMDKTVEHAPRLAQLPEAMKEMVLATLGRLALTITEKGLLFMNPAKEDIQAYYKILEETDHTLSIQITPLNGKAPKKFELSIEENRLSLAGATPDGTCFYFDETVSQQLEEEERHQFQEKLKDSAMKFLGTMLQQLQQAFNQKEN